MVGGRVGYAKCDLDVFQEGRIRQVLAPLPEVIPRTEDKTIAAPLEGLAFEKRRVTAAIGVRYDALQHSAASIDQAHPHTGGRNAVRGVEHMCCQSAQFQTSRGVQWAMFEPSRQCRRVPAK